MVESDIANVRSKAKLGCKEFLKFINDSYTPDEKKLTLDDEAL